MSAILTAVAAPTAAFALAASTALALAAATAAAASPALTLRRLTVLTAGSLPTSGRPLAGRTAFVLLWHLVHLLSTKIDRFYFGLMFKI